MENKISIFTPTYNRENTLIDTYNSLKNQTNKDFVWIIIDDGSTDNTKKLVEQWENEKIIEINYYYKANGGKHTAYNFMLNKVETEYVLIALDSDDTFTTDAIEFFYNCINNNLKDDIRGVVALCAPDINKKFYKSEFDLNKLQHLSLKDAICSDYFKRIGAIFLFETKLLNKYKYPIFENEKFFTEIYTYMQMDFSMHWTDKIVCQRIFGNGGLTKEIYKLYIKNPKSFYLYNNLRYKESKKLFVRFKALILVDAFLLMCNKEFFSKNIKDFNKISFLPLGFILKKMIERKAGEYNNV